MGIFGRKDKQKHKSKEQLLAEKEQVDAQKKAIEEQQKEIARRRALAKDIYFPILLKHSKSIRHAQQTCKIVENAILTLHNQELATKALSDLKLAEHFKGDDEASAAFREIIGAFKNEKLNACLDVIGGMSGAIDSFIAEEQNKRPLADLKTHFL